MSLLPKSVNCVGTVTMVAVKFAYVSTPKGTVFCPLAASVSQDEIVPDMSRRYSVGDVVHIQAVQQEAKNGCGLRARKMRHVKPKPLNDVLTFDDSLITEIKCSAMVGHIQESFIIADSVEHGSVFVPRTIFPRSETVFTDVELGEQLDMIIRSQPERNNCRWVALSVLFSTKPVLPSVNEEHFQGYGVLQAVEPMVASLETKNGTVFCPILTWVGGDRDTDASTLDEILQCGDKISFKAVNRGGVWRAVRWSLFNEPEKQAVTMTNSFTQTVPSAQDLLFRIALPILRELTDEKPSLDLLLSTLEDDGL